jgi:hypothetical protein
MFFVIILLAFSFCFLGFQRVGWFNSFPVEGDDTRAEFAPKGSFWVGPL